MVKKLKEPVLTGSFFTYFAVCGMLNSNFVKTYLMVLGLSAYSNNRLNFNVQIDVGKKTTPCVINLETCLRTENREFPSLLSLATAFVARDTDLMVTLIKNALSNKDVCELALNRWFLDNYNLFLSKANWASLSGAPYGASIVYPDSKGDYKLLNGNIVKINNNMESRTHIRYRKIGHGAYVDCEEITTTYYVKVLRVLFLSSEGKLIREIKVEPFTDKNVNVFDNGIIQVDNEYHGFDIEGFVSSKVRNLNDLIKLVKNPELVLSKTDSKCTLL